jgi:NAD(P)-dependent dehydrogenase (short-subunit alcohol dehydrogenase family)
MTDRIALVTGASRGFGAAMAEELASRGFHIVAVARTTGGLEEVDDRIQAAGGQATLAPMDITNDDAMRQLCLSVYERWGHVDLWVHAAIHAAPLSPTPDMGEKDWDRSIATNVRATGRLIQFVDPLLRLSATGTALFLDDPHGGEAFFGAYGATKTAQIALARSWQAETQRTAPRVLIETPAPMPTATRARFFPGEDRTPLTAPRAEAARLAALL